MHGGEVYNVHTYFDNTNIILGAFSYFKKNKYYLLFNLTTRIPKVSVVITICLGETRLSRSRFSFSDLAEMLYSFRNVVLDGEEEVDETFETDYSSWEKYGFGIIKSIIEYIYDTYNDDNIDECWDYAVSVSDDVKFTDSKFIDMEEIE